MNRVRDKKSVKCFFKILNDRERLEDQWADRMVSKEIL
jgi:hypothetical protein